jgi:hypothetical protein
MTFNHSISPLLIMQQWHYGLTLPDGTQIGPLKNISPKDCPKKQRRTFQRMRKFLQKHRLAAEFK